MKKLVLTGSHAATTGLAVIEEIQERGLDVEIFWIGKKYASEGQRQTTLEYNTFTKQGIKFYNLESGRIQNKFTRFTIPALLKIPFGFIQSLYYLLKIKPDLVLSFGGAAGALISFWSWVLRIPVIIHEQTSTAGRANLWSKRFAKKIALARESSLRHFPKEKSIVVGNPINKKLIEISNSKSKNVVKTILITGGSRGSKWINEAIKPILTDLFRKYYVIHQIGERDFQDFEDIKDEKYLKISQVSPTEWIEILKKADLVISRSGANTVSELIALKRPAILIPIPWSFGGEQNENALYMESLGLAKIIPQSKLTSNVLLQEITNTANNYFEIVKSVKNVKSPDFMAAKALVDLLDSYIKPIKD